jgi:hypothetical protein
MPEPAPQRGVGDEPCAVDLDHDGAVPEPGDPIHSRPLPPLGIRVKDP